MQSSPSHSPTLTAIFLIAPARLSHALLTPGAQTPPIVFRSPVRQLLQVGGPNSLLRDFRDLRAIPMHCRIDWRIR